MRRTLTLRAFSIRQKIVAYMLVGLVPLSTMPEVALALPHGGVVSKGSATLGYATGKLGIHQSTNSATFNWSSYNVKAGQSVVYSVPGSRSVSLNYIGGTTPSSINGSVTSNGILEFMNPNGLIFGAGSVVSAAGVMAFGSATPWGKPTGPVTNAGTLTVANDGTVALVGTSVANLGRITAPGGTVVLAAGSTVTPIAATLTSSFSVATTGGGRVDDSGIVSAETTGGRTGTIVLQSGMDSGTMVLEAGAVLDASAPNGGNGGRITLNAYHLVLDNVAPPDVSAPDGTKGTVTIDPTITTVGTPSALEAIDASQTAYLNNSTVCIELTASINLGGSYSWIPLGNGSSPSSHFIGIFNGNGYAVSGYTITATSSNGTGFIGFLGAGGTVKNLGVSGTVNGGSDFNVGGLVGKNIGGSITNSYATGSISGTGKYIGGLVGNNFASSSSITNSYATGSVSGGSYIGGLAGDNGGSITNSYATGSVSGTGSYVGGLAGNNRHTITNSYATGSLTGGSDVGGLAGDNGGSITNSYATGTVSGGSGSGGLAGYSGGSITNSYATGSISGTGNYIGGLVGNNHNTITNSYATGNVTGANTSTDLGGLVGYNNGGTYTSDYWNSSATISSGNTTGVGNSNSSVPGVTGLSAPAFGTSGNFSGWSFNIWSNGAFQSSPTSSPWFEGTVSGNVTNAPMLVGAMPSVTVAGNSLTTPYNGTSQSPGTTQTQTGGAPALPGSDISYSGGPNVGTYALTPVLSGTSAPTAQAGTAYFVSSGTLTITPANLTVTANRATVPAGSAIPILSGTVTGFVNGQTLSGDSGGTGTTMFTTVAMSSSYAGSYLVTGTVNGLSSPYAGDYTVIQAAGNGSALTITGGITIDNFNPVLQSVGLQAAYLIQNLPPLPGISPNNFSSAGSTTLASTGTSSLKVLHPVGGPEGEILSVHELKK